MKKIVSQLMIVMAFAAMPCAAMAGTDCTVTTTTLSFGSYDVLSLSDTTASGNVRISCSSNSTSTAIVPTTVLIGAGSAGGAWATSRRMNGAPGILNYQIYRDAARTAVWNANNPFSSTATAVTLSGQVDVPAFKDVPVYGRIPNRQNVGIGSYTDTLSVIIDF